MERHKEFNILDLTHRKPLLFDGDAHRIACEKSQKELDEYRNQLMLEKSISDGESRTIYLIYRNVNKH